jgi:DNA-binding response OmpR family regulator
MIAGQRVTPGCYSPDGVYMKRPMILIIEDDSFIRDELTMLLETEGYGVSALTGFTEAAGVTERLRPDLILLDLGLPGKDGFTLCKEIRRVSAAPVIFVTSRDNSMDELKALSLGGDDYITKPYNIPVLLARIKAVLRRGAEFASQHAARDDIIEANGLRLDIAKAELTHGGKSIEATKNEIKILTCLMRREGEYVPRADLIEYLWDNQVYVDDNTLSVNVTRLRAKLGGLGLPDYVTTKRGMGYRV